MRAVLVSRWCANGDIVEYLRKNPGSNRIQLIGDMANGLQYLHNQVPAIVHGDLKPHNVLISDQGVAKLCDFGLSRILSELSKFSQSTSAVSGFTTRYSACEVIFEGIKTVKSDVYAFGCTCIHVLFDQRPFPELNNDNRVITAIDNGQSPWPWDQGIPLHRILSACCSLDQESRPSIESVLQELHLSSSLSLIPEHPGHAPNASIPLGISHIPSNVGNAANDKKERSVSLLNKIPLQGAETQGSHMRQSVQGGLENVRRVVFRTPSHSSARRLRLDSWDLRRRTDSLPTLPEFHPRALRQKQTPV